MAQKTAPTPLRLLQPSPELLPGYAAALATGWSPNNVIDVSAEQLAAVQEDPSAFLADLTRQGGTIALPDGASVPRLPFLVRWMWDGEFCGHISLRWQAGTDALPPYVLGHIGYAVVPWKRGRGYATWALGFMLGEARRVGLRRLEITTEPDNRTSRHIIETNGGRLVEEFVNAHYGSELRLRYTIDL